MSRVVVRGRPGVWRHRVRTCRGPITSASCTWIQPPGVCHVVISDVGARHVPARRRHVDPVRPEPERPGSPVRIVPKTLAESKAGRHSQSTDPSGHQGARVAVRQEPVVGDGREGERWRGSRRRPLAVRGEPAHRRTPPSTGAAARGHHPNKTISGTAVSRSRTVSVPQNGPLSRSSNGVGFANGSSGRVVPRRRTWSASSPAARSMRVDSEPPPMPSRSRSRSWRRRRRWVRRRPAGRRRAGASRTRAPASAGRCRRWRRSAPACPRGCRPRGRRRTS